MTTNMQKILIARQSPEKALELAGWLTEMGFQTVIAHGSYAILEQILRHSFAGLLIDIDLPDLNGPVVARALRDGEVGSRRHIPIIGIAPSVATLKTPWKDSGMDRVLVTPFSQADLREVMTACAAIPTTAVAPTPTFAEVADGCLDTGKVAEFIDSDPELFGEMVDLMIQEYPRRMAQMTAAIDQQDGKTLERAAHSLKGALSYFCRKFLLQGLQLMERCGREMNFATAADLRAQLENLFPLLTSELQRQQAQAAHATAPAAVEMPAAHTV